MHTVIFADFFCLHLPTYDDRITANRRIGDFVDPSHFIGDATMRWALREIRGLRQL